MAPSEDPDLDEISRRTRAHYEVNATRFEAGTRDHDVSQNIDALLDALDGPGPFRILDFGCGPGRDLARFLARGHTPIGLDGSAAFVDLARGTGAEVWLQDFLALELPEHGFDGVFANASLFHVPRRVLPRVLGELFEALRPGGVLFASNPRGDDDEGWNGERYGSYHSLERWSAFVIDAGFEPIRHYYRPPGLPRDQQPWLATLWRRPRSGRATAGSGDGHGADAPHESAREERERASPERVRRARSPRQGPRDRDGPLHWSDE